MAVIVCCYCQSVRVALAGCPAGRYINGTDTGGASPVCAPCPAGTFSSAPNSSVCTACPAGTFSSTTAAALCADCPAGRYGMASPDHSGIGLTTDACSGACTPGYACPQRSTNSTALLCPAGRFSPGGAGTCTPCTAGRWGALAGQSNATTGCAGVCAPGYACPAGSPSATPSSWQCPPGTYCPGGSSAWTLCSQTAPYSPAGAAASSACVSCAVVTSPVVQATASGRYGASTGASSCDGGLHGAYLCPDKDWLPWIDAAGVEGVNSCVKVCGCFALLCLALKLPASFMGHEVSGPWSPGQALAGAPVPTALYCPAHQDDASLLLQCAVAPPGQPETPVHSPHQPQVYQSLACSGPVTVVCAWPMPPVRRPWPPATGQKPTPPALHPELGPIC